MKTLGLIGGTSWVSTAEYYRIINQQVNEKLGGLNSAKLFLYSLNLEEFKPPTDLTTLDEMENILTNIAQKLQQAGAECIIICANTPHLVADRLINNISIPLIHIAEVTANELSKANIRKVGLLGTKATMEQDFFKKKLADVQIDTIIPAAESREFINNSIKAELSRGIFSEETKRKYSTVIQELVRQGAEAIILGCTEIPLLIKPGDCSVPVFDTTLLHATAAVAFALE